MEEKKHKPLEIDNKKVNDYIEFVKREYNQHIDFLEAEAELKKLRSKGCLLYDDCRSCPLFGKHCPI